MLNGKTDKSECKNSCGKVKVNFSFCFFRKIRIYVNSVAFAFYNTDNCAYCRINNGTVFAVFYSRVSRIVTCNADTQRQFFNQYVAEKVLQCRYCKLCNFFYQVQKPLNTVFFYKARLFFCCFFRLFGFLSLFFCFFLSLFLFGFCRHKLKLYKSDIHGAPKLLFI